MTKIEWCNETINPIQDSIKGESGRGYHLPFDGRKAEFELIQSELEKLAKWKKPRSIFVQSMGDLFHEDMPFDLIYAITKLAQTHTAYHTDHHTYLFLTKRHDNLIKYIDYSRWNEKPERNVYLGLTVCTQQEWDDKGKLFMQIPGNKFLSLEPLLEEIKLKGSGCQWCFGSGVNPASGTPCPQCFDIQGVILGGETGPKARPMHPDWVRSVRDQCEQAGVPFFFKGWGEWGHGSQYSELKKVKRWEWAGEGHAAAIMARIGKKAAGRILDGSTHDDLPWIV
uniref:DUF5131 family protein n=1 Tax=viral metagenome TaxID=1070528 RepID=A0A6H1ZEP1_9ZZZZ